MINPNQTAPWAFKTEAFNESPNITYWERIFFAIHLCSSEHLIPIGVYGNNI